jgi:hypothetical protein
MADSLELRAVARRQDFVISRVQALNAGLSRHAIGHRLRSGGPWRLLLPGIYLMQSGSATPAQQEIAAMIYAGPQAAITGAAALRFYGFRPVPPHLAEGIDLLVPLRMRRANVGPVRVHRTAHPPACVHGGQGRRYAPPARAVADAARWLSDLREVRALVGHAVQNDYCAVEQLAQELAAGGRPRGGLLRQAITEARAGVRSAPEADLRDLLLKARLPLPLFNPRLYRPDGTFIACPDAWWPEAGVAIEVDSRQWHLAPADWERTMTRHSDLGQYGIVTLHVTPHQLRTQPDLFTRKATNAYNTGIARPRLNILALPAAA